MSLINEALKKAQKQRTESALPAVSVPNGDGEPLVRIARRAKPVGFNSLMIRVGVIVVGLLVASVGVVYIVRALSEEPALAEAPPAPKIATATKATPPALAPDKPLSDGAAADNTFKVTTPPAGNPAPGPVASSAVPETKPSPTEVAPSAENIPQIKLPPAPPRMEPRSIAVIETLRVAGIRALSAESRVLMNDRVYRVGDTIDHELGLKLVVISAHALTFEGPNGARYTRNF